MYVYLCAVCGGKCSAATAQEMKCMTDAATKHVADFEADCYDINFVDLQNKEVSSIQWK